MSIDDESSGILSLDKVDNDVIVLQEDDFRDQEERDSISKVAPLWQAWGSREFHPRETV